MPTDRARHAASFAVLAGFLALNTATSKAPRPYPGPTPSPTPTVDAKAPATLAWDAGVTGATDLDAAAVTRAVGCVGRTTDACRVLADFARASTPKDLPKTGSDVWFGTTWAAPPGPPGSLAPRAPSFLKIQRGYTPSPVPRLEDAVLDVSAVLALVRSENAPEADSTALALAVKDGKPAPAGNRAAEYAHTYSPVDWNALVSTTGASIALVTEAAPPHVFARALGDRLLVVEYDGGKPLAKGKSSSQAWCAELWKVR